MSQKNIKKNYFFNLLYQIFGLITPLVVTPYISRVLGSSGVGQYSFTFSIATYFVLFATLGFNTYAQREIARFQGDKHQQSVVFWEIFIARLIPTFISLTVYAILILLNIYERQYILLMLILTINVVSVIFDVSFLFQGNENFAVIALRNILIKTIGVILIFVFVKNESHVWLYTLCQSLILIVSNLSLWTRLPKSLTKVSLKELNIKKHFVPTIRLFIPTIAVSVYTILDKTLIGVLVNGVNDSGTKISDIENGVYEQSEKLVKMALTVVTSLGMVMIPRNSQAVSSGNYGAFKANVKGALRFVFFVGIPIMFGLAAIAQNMSPWFFGDGFEKVPYLIMMFCPLVLIIGISNVLGLQYLIPLKKDNKYTIAIVAGAALNLLLNLILIPLLWSYGACIATISAELLVTLMMYLFARKDIPLFEIFGCTWKYVASGTIMFLMVYFSQSELEPTIINTVLLIVKGFFFYTVLLFVFQDTMFLKLVSKIGKPFYKSN